MARNISIQNQSALNARALEVRDFVFFTARIRATGAPATVGFWSDYGAVNAQVMDPETNIATTKAFYGFAGLIAIEDIHLTANLSSQDVKITMSQIDDVVDQLFRDYDCKLAKVEIYRGLLDPASQIMVAPAECRFFGFVDNIEVTTPSENEEGSVIFTCISHTLEMTRSNSDTRSHATQIVRAVGDAFYKDTATVSEWEIWWGKTSGKVATVSSTPTTSKITGNTVNDKTGGEGMRGT